MARSIELSDGKTKSQPIFPSACSKVQFIGVIHQPDLMILDEPFPARPGPSTLKNVILI
jgi:ABC-type uncharacterized transport system ATPase subunit